MKRAGIPQESQVSTIEVVYTWNGFCPSDFLLFPRPSARGAAAQTSVLVENLSRWIVIYVLCGSQCLLNHAGYASVIVILKGATLHYREEQTSSMVFPNNADNADVVFDVA